MPTPLNAVSPLVAEFPTPYDVPVLLWNKIETYFEKYNVAIREAKPQDTVSGPVIVWDIYNRTPGRANSPAQSRGPTFSHVKTTRDGKIIDWMMQVHTVTYRFKIYAHTPVIANQIAWDLERLLPQAAGIVGRQDNLPGLQINFLRQFPQEEDRVGILHDELIVRGLFFIAQVPVFTEQEQIALTTIRVKSKIGRKLTTTGRLTRTSAESRYDIPVPSGQAAVGILAIFRIASGTASGDVLLQQNVDYFVKKEDDGTLYIEWNDTYGNVPAVGDDFQIEYFNSAVRISYPDLD